MSTSGVVLMWLWNPNLPFIFVFGLVGLFALFAGAVVLYAKVSDWWRNK